MLRTIPPSAEKHARPCLPDSRFYWLMIFLHSKFKAYSHAYKFSEGLATLIIFFSRSKQFLSSSSVTHSFTTLPETLESIGAQLTTDSNKISSLIQIWVFASQSILQSRALISRTGFWRQICLPCPSLDSNLLLDYRQVLRMASYNDVFGDDDSPSWLTATKECDSDDQIFDHHSAVIFLETAVVHRTWESPLNVRSWASGSRCNAASGIKSGWMVSAVSTNFILKLTAACFVCHRELGRSAATHPDSGLPKQIPDIGRDQSWTETWARFRIIRPKDQCRLTEASESSLKLFDRILRGECKQDLHRIRTCRIPWRRWRNFWITSNGRHIPSESRIRVSTGDVNVRALRPRIPWRSCRSKNAACWSRQEPEVGEICLSVVSDSWRMAKNWRQRSVLLKSIALIEMQRTVQRKSNPE